MTTFLGQLRYAIARPAGRLLVTLSLLLVFGGVRFEVHAHAASTADHQHVHVHSHAAGSHDHDAADPAADPGRLNGGGELLHAHELGTLAALLAIDMLPQLHVVPEARLPALRLAAPDAAPGAPPIRPPIA